MSWFHFSVLQVSIVIGAIVLVFGTALLVIWHFRKKGSAARQSVPVRPRPSVTVLPPATSPTPSRSVRTSVPLTPPLTQTKRKRPWRSRASEPELTAGSQVGDGGQGTVHDVPGHPELVIKKFGRAIPDATSLFEQIIAFGPTMQEAVGPSVDLCWPLEARGTDQVLEGYLMPRIKPEFYFEASNRRRTIRRERQLDWAVSGPIVAGFQIPFVTTDADRLELLRLFTLWLGAMHERELVYGDISWKNFSFSLNPVRLAVYDFDQTRIVGVASFTRGEPADSVDWKDESAPEIGPATLDTDRYRYALMAFRLLVSKDRHSHIDENAVPAELSGFDRTQTARLRALWRRAAGLWGSRPTVAEWAAILST